MKKMISLTMWLVFLCIFSFGQKIMPDKVPGKVKEAFMKEYPKAMESSWRMDNSNYQVIFTLMGTKHAIKYDKTGQWIDKEERIELSNLPKEITASITKNFAGYKAYEAEKVETPMKGTLYNVGIEKEKEFLEAHFSVTGDVLDKVVKKMKTEWGKDND